MTERHLSADSFAGYLRSRSPIEHPIFGNPRLFLFIDPQRGRVGLRGPAAPNETAPPSGLEHLSIHTVHHDGERMIEIAVTESRLFEDAYPVLRSIADRVQLDGLRVSDATVETMARLGHLLRPEEGLSRQVETGLLGELCLLAGLTTASDATTALASWRGGHAEEHDFGLLDFDVEVKTTASERRAHRISPLTQLVPTGTRPLWLVSFQVTLAGTGGTTLGDLVSRVRQLISGATDRRRLDELLYATGWRDRYARTCEHRWRLRTEPATFAVSGTFPHLSPAMLDSLGVDPAHITDVTYRLELTGRPEDAPPRELADAVNAAGLELA
ncbi:PD-(D/E)XK motif protein [Luedemannella helvata]|uniref:PD-(D/E)XK motif protein n=1 Tax=Luedemannella helvata TaxID=349315 RepID=A0ABN2L6A7_9ACTN